MSLAGVALRDHNLSISWYADRNVTNRNNRYNNSQESQDVVAEEVRVVDFAIRRQSVRRHVLFIENKWCRVRPAEAGRARAV